MDQWKPIARAEKHVGKEILGSVWAEQTMIREPFVSFWSPTLNKFYCSPTHYIDMPEPPVSAPPDGGREEPSP